MEHVIGGKFKLGRKIGSGSFGELYLGTVHTGFLDLSFVSVCSRCEALYPVRYWLIHDKVDYIGFQETKKETFSSSFLKKLMGNRKIGRAHV